MRIARSIRCRICAGSVHISTNSRDVLVERLQVDLLLVVRAERRALLLADDREHRHVVELRVVEAVQQVHGARAGRRHADADLVGAGELRVAARHERGHLLVARLDELGPALLLRAVERAEEGVDPVARVAVDALDPPLAQALQDVVGDELGHRDPPVYIGVGIAQAIAAELQCSTCSP